MNKTLILCQKSFKYNYFSLPFLKIKPPSVAFILQGFPIFHRIIRADIRVELKKSGVRQNFLFR